MSIIIAVIIFSVIVLFHEFGHFSMARLCGVEVLEFSLGMGPRLLSHVSRKSNTRYSVKLLPFGGSCLMKGEDGDDMTPGAFGTKKIWQRILIVAAGPVFNFILAFLFAAIIIGSAGYDAPVPEYLTEDSPLAKAGIVRGDTITSIDGRRITIYRDIANYVTFDLDARQSARTAGAWKAVQIPVEWEHDGKKMTPFWWKAWSRRCSDLPYSTTKSWMPWSRWAAHRDPRRQSWECMAAAVFRPMAMSL